MRSSTELVVDDNLMILIVPPSLLAFSVISD
jgi:hypothetical protein